MKIRFLLILLALSNCVFSQLNIDNGSSLILSPNSIVYVTGNVNSNVSIRGGTLVMNGSSIQTLSMNGDTITKLQITNPENVTLGIGSTYIDSSLTFTSGKLKTGIQNLILSTKATIAGAGSSKFLWTDSTGFVKKNLSSNVSGILIPLGENSNYRPILLTTIGNTFSTTANIGLQCKKGLYAKLPPMIANRINAYWNITKAGITGGTVEMTAQYKTSDIIGTERTLVGYFYNKTDWTSTSETHDTVLHRISMPVTANNGVLIAMNKFIAVGARALLQGAYNPSTGLMYDSLRLGTNKIPTSDPYRTLPYSLSFIHVNNTNKETALSTVFTNKTNSNDNIVDWVFLELRNTSASPGNNILQTRSALIQRDGDIVDIDGISPVTFNNILDGNYALSIRHRNHLGLSLNPTIGSRNFTEKSSIAFTTNVVDFRTSNLLFGTINSYATSTHPTLSNVKLLWAGNANMNGIVKYVGLQNDKDYILVNTLTNVPTKVISNTYSPADINMNKTVNYTGARNDKDYLFIDVLGSMPTAQKIQSLPN